MSEFMQAQKDSRFVDDIELEKLKQRAVNDGQIATRRIDYYSTTLGEQLIGLTSHRQGRLKPATQGKNVRSASKNLAPRPYLNADHPLNAGHILKAANPISLGSSRLLSR